MPTLLNANAGVVPIPPVVAVSKTELAPLGESHFAAVVPAIRADAVHGVPALERTITHRLAGVRIDRKPLEVRRYELLEIGGHAFVVVAPEALDGDERATRPNNRSGSDACVHESFEILARPNRRLWQNVGESPDREHGG